MQHPDNALACFIASTINREIEPYLEERHFCHGLVMFAIPDYGVLFRCRVDAAPVDLEFAAFFSLLKFIKTQVNGQRPAHLIVHSSNPEFVFSFTPQSRHLARGSQRERLLAEYLQLFDLHIRFVESGRNKALLSTADYPSLPAHVPSVVKPAQDDVPKKCFKPFQRGIKL